MTDGGRRRWSALALAVAAATLTGCATASADVQVAAATRSAAAQTWFLDSSGGMPVPPPAPTTIGLSPVIPRPGEFAVPRPAPYGVPPVTSPPPAVCGGDASPGPISPGALPGPGRAPISWQAGRRPPGGGHPPQGGG